MNRRLSARTAILGIAIAGLFVACSNASGPLGSVPVASGSPDPAVVMGSPDATPAGSDQATTPSGTPGLPGPSDGASASPGSSPTGTTIVRAYFWLGGAQGSAGLVPVLRQVPATKAVATAAVNALLAGPNGGEIARTISTEIPAGSQLLGITIEGGIATVDLSSEFESGGASGAVGTRVAEVVYTVTQFSNVKSVVIEIEGEAKQVFSSQGTALSQPISRADYADQLPDIWVDRPAFNAAIGNPAHITGNADVFEATFRIAILDGKGAPLADEQVMATCGTGCRGTFDVTIPYVVAKAQYGTLRAYNLSAADGSPESVRDYRVWLTP